MSTSLCFLPEPSTWLVFRDLSPPPSFWEDFLTYSVRHLIREFWPGLTGTMAGLLFPPTFTDKSQQQVIKEKNLNAANLSCGVLGGLGWVEGTEELSPFVWGECKSWRRREGVLPRRCRLLALEISPSALGISEKGGLGDSHSSLWRTLMSMFPILSLE